MTITLISDPLDAGANTYADLAYADGYFAARMHGAAWLEASRDDQAVALVHATRMLNQLVDWRGTVADVDQPNAWPRVGVQIADRPAGTLFDPEAASFPTFLADVCCEVAHDSLLDNRLEDDATGLSSMGLDSLRLSFNTKDRSDYFSEYVRTLISSYGRVKSRTPSVVPLSRR